MAGQDALAHIGQARAQDDANAETADFTPRRMAFSIDEVLMLAFSSSSLTRLGDERPRRVFASYEPNSVYESATASGQRNV
jgi:hypothetical protein